MRCRHGYAFAFRCSSARVSTLECELMCARQAAIESIMSSPSRSFRAVTCAASAAPMITASSLQLRPQLSQRQRQQSSLHLRQWSSASRLLQAALTAAVFLRPLQLSRAQREHACVVEFISPVPVASCAAPKLWKGPWSAFLKGSYLLLLSCWLRHVVRLNIH